MNVIDALASNAAGICQYGRTVTLTADQDAPACRGFADQLVTITTDDGELNFSLCKPHKTSISRLTRAEDLTTVVDAGGGESR